MGDKLTAFAPHTIGVPFFRGKDSMHLEIIKQMFDCWTILQEMDDFHMVSQNYDIIAEKEIVYWTQYRLVYVFWEKEVYERMNTSSITLE